MPDRIEGTRWIDDTRAIRREAYHALRDRLFVELRDQPGVERYGTFGSVSCPGLSDLDLAVVVTDDALRDGSFRLPHLAPDERYIMIHAPLVLPASAAPELAFYHPIDIEWNTSSGPLPETSAPPPALSLFHIWRKTLVVQSALWRLLAPPAACRRTIMALTSLCRSIQRAAPAGLESLPEELAYIDSVDQMRSEWFASEARTSPDLARLDSLVHQARGVALHLPERLASVLLDTTSRPAVAARIHRDSPASHAIEIDLNARERITRIAQRHHSAPRTSGRVDRLARLVRGRLAFVGPLGSALYAYAPPAASEFRAATGSRTFGAKPDSQLAARIHDAVGETIQHYYSVNMHVADCLTAAGLTEAYFGDLFIARGPRRWLIRALTWHTTRRLRRLLQ